MRRRLSLAKQRDVVSTPKTGLSGSRAAAGQPRLLDRLREALRSRHYSHRTEETYCHWVKRFIFFHDVRNPAEMAEAEINAFVTHLAVRGMSALRRRIRHCPHFSSFIGTCWGVRSAIG